MNKYELSYFGTSKEFFEKLKKFLSIEKELGIDLEQVEKFPQIENKETRITVIIDQELLAKDKYLLNRILKIRRSRYSSNYLFVILENSFYEDCRQLIYFRSGVNFIIVRDGDITLSLNQLFYLMIEEDFPCPKFATTRKFYAKADIQLPVFITQIDKNVVTTTSDFPMEDEVELTFSNDLYLNLKVEEDTTNVTESFNLYKTSFSYIESNPWDEVHYSNWDTIETRLQDFSDSHQTVKHKVLLIDTSETYRKLKDVFTETMEKIDVDVIDHSSIDDITLRDNNYKIVIVGKLSGDVDRVDYIFDFIAGLTNLDLSNPPVIVIPDFKSKKEAVVKVTGYDKIFCFENILNKEILSKFFTALSSQELAKTDTYQIGLNEKDSISYLDKEVYVTSMSEFFITFTVADELPLYSYLRIDIGIVLNLLLIPPLRFLDKVGGKPHYMAFIFLLSEENLKLLRQGVNFYMNIEVNEINNKFKSFFDKKYEEIEVVDEVVDEVEEDLESGADESTDSEEQSNGIEDLYEESDEPVSKVKYKKGYITKI